MFYEGLKGLHKTFWDTTKSKDKNLTWFLFQYNFQKCTGQEGFKYLRSVMVFPLIFTQQNIVGQQISFCR